MTNQDVQDVQDVLLACGNALASGDLFTAEQTAQSYLQEYAEHSAVRGVLGAVCLERGNYKGAILEYSTALKWGGPNPDCYYAIGLAYQKLGNLAQACQFWVQAVSCDPAHVDAVVNAAQAALQLEKWELALTVCQAGLEAGVDDARLWQWSGHALAKLKRDAAAAAAYGRAVAVFPKDPTLRYLQALALRDSQQYDLARKGFEALLLMQPDHADAAFEAAQLDLMQQRWQSGFALWEARLRRELPLLPPEMPGELWCGRPCKDSTLLVQAEQGAGDTLQFARYLPFVCEQVKKVILRVHPALVRLLQRGIMHWPKNWEIVDFSTRVEADLHIPLLSLPNVLGLNAPCVKHATYLSGLRDSSGEIKSEISPQVGIVWAGTPVHHNDGRRSAPFSAFAKLQDVPNVTFVHFQMDAVIAASEQWPSLVDATKGINDFWDTAQRLLDCDLLISVDTAAVHLAGAMAMPTWVLVPDVPDWRWGAEEENTPWYPSVRVMRQTAKGNWDELLSRVRDELVSYFTANKSCGGSTLIGEEQ